jgi:ankyrin repeat protein
MLLENGAQIYVYDLLGNTPIKVAEDSKNSKKGEIIALLQKKRLENAIPDMCYLLKKKDSNSFILLKELWNLYKIAKEPKYTDLLFPSGQYKDWYLIHYTAAHGNLNFFEFLINEYGSDNMSNVMFLLTESQISPLDLAIKNNNTEIVKYYANSKCPLCRDKKTINKIITYYIAQALLEDLTKYWDQVKVTYPKLSPSTIPDEKHKNWTFLHYAAASGNSAMLSHLLQIENDWTLLTDDGNNVAEIAIINNHRSCVEHIP